MFEWQENDLNSKQKNAIIEDNNVLLVACPGSGKTRTLTYKIALELSKLDSKKAIVVAITYTNRAANEIKDRIEELGINTEQLWIGTIHSFCLDWIIKPYGIYHDKLMYGYRVINSYDTEEILANICKKYSSPKITHFDCGHYFDSTGLKTHCASFKNRNVTQAIIDYHEHLNINRQIDFEQILWYSFELIRDNVSISKILSEIFRYILIDEYQDTKEIQYRIISHILIAGNGKVKSFIVGDPNQAIFTSLGGYAIPIDELNSMCGSQFSSMDLSSNYRSSDKIVEYFSNFKVFHSPIESHAKHKHYESMINFNREVHKDDIIDEIVRLIELNINKYDIKPSEICVVAPWWIHLASLTRRLVIKLPEYNFDGPGLTPFVRDLDNFWYKVARIILSEPSPSMYRRRLRWAHEVLSHFSDVGIYSLELKPKQLLRICNSIHIKEDDGLKYLKLFFDEIFLKINVSFQENHSLTEHYKSFFESSKARIARIIKDGFEYAGDIKSFKKAFQVRSGITVSTIHGIKGAEFDTVIAFALLDGMVPHFTDVNKNESAKKLLYVICSRARKNLHLISEQGRKKGNSGYYYQPTNELIKIGASS